MAPAAASDDLAASNEPAGFKEPCAHSIYLNILIAETTPELTQTIKEKVSEKVPNPLGFGVLGKIAGKAAVKMATKSKVAEGMAQKIPEILPEKMAEMGIVASAEEVFLKGTFVVIRIEVYGVDTGVIFEKAMGEEKQEKADKVLACLKGLARCFGYTDLFTRKVQTTMKTKITQALCEKLPVTLPPRLAEKGLLADIVTKSADEEADYFFEAIRHVEALHAAPTNAEPGDGSSAAQEEADGPRRRRLFKPLRRQRS